MWTTNPPIDANAPGEQGYVQDMETHERLDPSMAAVFASLPIPDASDDTLQMFRVSWEGPPSEHIERSDHAVPGEPGLTVRVTRPKGVDGPLPCLFWIHGGGYVTGSPAMDDPMFADLCPALGIASVAIDYRLAPETSYPGPLEDCYRGLVWTHDHADELGIDRSVIGIGGRSSGAGLTAALALLVRDRNEVEVGFQLLDCPMLDDRQVTVSSQFEDLPVWSKVSNEFGWRSYLGELYGRDEVPATAVPGRASDLTGLPPAFISVGSVDGFLDEDVDYALRLNHAGVPCELHVYPGAPHGYQMAADSPIVVQARRDIEDWLRRQIERTT